MRTDAKNFDASQFEKLYRFATSIPSGRDNAPERDNARRFAEKIANKAGMTFEEGAAFLKSIDAKPSAREQAQAERTAKWKAYCAESERQQREAQEQAEQARRDRQREQEAREARARMEAERREQIATIWRKACPESEIELALARAARQLGIDPYEPLRWTDSPAVESAARHASSFPNTFAAAVAEVEALETAREQRRTKVKKYDFGGLLSLRRELILRYLTSDPATPEDASARAEWIVRSGGHALGTDADDWMKILASDIIRLKASLDTAKDKLAAERRKHDHHTARPAKPIKQTSAQKRKAVNDILDGPGADKLTLREVAERAGVHHSTVAEIRRERQGHA